MKLAIAAVIVGVVLGAWVGILAAAMRSEFEGT